MLCSAGLLSVAIRECLLSRHGIIDAEYREARALKLQGIVGVYS
jgi:hypothetical protein